MRLGKHLLFGVVALAACGGRAPLPPLDGGPPPFADGGAPQVEVGTGQFEFVPVAAGAPIEIVCGPQGGQHIWVSVRARNLSPDPVSIRVSIRLADSGQLVCGQQIDDTSLFAAAGGWGEFTGIACFVPEPALVSGRPVLLQGRVADAAGRAGDHEVRAVPFGPSRDCTIR